MRERAGSWSRAAPRSVLVRSGSSRDAGGGARPSHPGGGSGGGLVCPGGGSALVLPVREFRRGLDCPGGDVSDCHSAAVGDHGRRGGLTLSPRWSRRIGPKLSGRLMAPSTKESNTASYSLAQKGLAMRGKSAG